MDTVTAEKRSEMMQAIRGKDTEIELLVRRLLHQAGYRYRLHRADLPGKPDIVFPGRRKIIFVHGCFWHHHPDPQCKISHSPKTNESYWSPKLEKTVLRDTKNVERLQELGWQSYVIWECQIKQPDDLLERLISFLSV